MGFKTILIYDSFPAIEKLWGPSQSTTNSLSKDSQATTTSLLVKSANQQVLHPSTSIPVNNHLAPKKPTNPQPPLSRASECQPIYSSPTGIITHLQLKANQSLNTSTFQTDTWFQNLCQWSSLYRRLTWMHTLLSQPGAQSACFRGRVVSVDR